MGARAPQIPHWHEILCIRYAAATQVRYLGLTTARPGTAHTPLHSIKFLDQRFCSTIFPLLPEEKYIIFFFFLFHMGTPPHQCIPPVGLAQGMFLPQHPRAGNTTVPAPVVLLPAGGVGGSYRWGLCRKSSQRSAYDPARQQSSVSLPSDCSKAAADLMWKSQDLNKISDNKKGRAEDPAGGRLMRLHPQMLKRRHFLSLQILRSEEHR